MANIVSHESEKTGGLFEGGPGSGPKKGVSFAPLPREVEGVFFDYHNGKLDNSSGVKKTIPLDKVLKVEDEAPDKDKVDAYVKRWQSGQEPPRVPVIEHQGNYYILDGQHRAFAAAKLDKDLPALVFKQKQKESMEPFKQQDGEKLQRPRVNNFPVDHKPHKGR